MPKKKTNKISSKKKLKKLTKSAKDVNADPLVFTTKSGHRLSLRQKRFCEYYIEFLGNRTKAAQLAGYEGTYESIRQQGSENLTKPHILEYIRELYDKVGLNDEIADVELAFVAKQHDNLNAKMQAIREYNDIKGRHAPQETVTLTYEELVRRKRAEGSR